MSSHASRAVAPNAQMHPGLLYRRFLQDLSSSLFSFVLPLLPTTEERAVKEEVRALIEKLVKTIEPSARLLAFGSSQNSFGLRNSDMDLVVLIDDPSAGLESSHLVQMIGDLLQRETNFDVKPLPKARIPILKLTLTPSPALPFGIACDIGIENRLAIENTRLLLTYATIDPARVRTLVLFLKVWAKRRRINSPYRGTLSSYGFTLMVLYFLVHVKQPPVLPNLQRIAPLRPLSEDDVMIQGRNVYFFDDTETLRQEWSSINFETVGELLIDFFRFFSHDFQFNNSVMSLRAGQLTKESKGWVNDIDVGGLNELARDRNRLCIEDPFEVTYNVARTVTKDGLYTIRGEFMRATRILTQRPDRAVLALAELCREREDDFRAPRSSSPAPRSMSTNRSGYSTPPIQGNPGWRSQSQVPFDRMNGPPHLEAPSSSSSRRGRRSEVDSEPASADYNQANSAQDMWLASQGNNLGNLGNLNLGLSFGESPYADPGRGRDPASRGLETPGGYNRTPRRGNNYDHGAGSGSISAPLSPHTLYAKLELGKPHAHIQPNPPNPNAPAGSGASGASGAGAGAGNMTNASASGWPTGNFNPPVSSIPAPTGGSTYRTPAASQAPSRAGSIVPGSAHAAALEAYAAQLGSGTHVPPGKSAGQTQTSHGGQTQHSSQSQGQSQGQGQNQSQGQGLGLGGIGQEVAAAGNMSMSMSSFQPFSPAVMPSSLLRALDEHEPGHGHGHGQHGQQSYISPSTLLSPAPAAPQELKGYEGERQESATAARGTSGTSGQGNGKTSGAEASGTGMDGLVSGFEKMGVQPPGQGAEVRQEGQSAGDAVEGKGKGSAGEKQT